MSRQIELGTPITDSFAIFAPDGFTRVSGENIFDVLVFVEGVPIVIPVSVTEIGATGEYLVEFTPTSAGHWKVQVFSPYDSIWREVSIDIVSLDAIAQVNVAFDDTVPRIYFEAWLERRNRHVPAASLVSCEIEFFDVAGASLFLISSVTPKADGHFSLHEDSALDSGRPYNIRVAITDSIGVIETLHGISTVG